MANLCCTVNPKFTCQNCDGKICEDCIKKGRTVDSYRWCEECYDLSSSTIEVIDDQFKQISEALSMSEDLASSIDDIGNHVSSCRTCRSEENCDNLYMIIDEAQRYASKHQRTIRSWR